MVEVLAGPNRFALQKAVEKKRQDFLREYGDLSVEAIEAEDAEPDEIISTLQGGTLFASQKLVVVKSLSENKNASESIEKIIDSNPDETSLLIVEPKPDKRSNYYKTLKQKADIKEFKELDEASLAKWLADEAKSLGAKLSLADANYLISRVGTSQARLHNELKKLADYNPDISRDQMDLLTEENPQNTVFQLLDAAFSGQKQRMFELYDNLRVSGTQPQMMIGMIAWQMHQVALVASAGNKSLDQISRDSGIKTFPLQKSQNIARKLGGAKIKELLARLEEFDRKSKTEMFDVDEGLKNFLSGVIS